MTQVTFGQQSNVVSERSISFDTGACQIVTYVSIVDDTRG